MYDINCVQLIKKKVVLKRLHLLTVLLSMTIRCVCPVNTQADYCSYSLKQILFPAHSKSV